MGKREALGPVALLGVVMLVAIGVGAGVYVAVGVLLGVVQAITH